MGADALIGPDLTANPVNSRMAGKINAVLSGDIGRPWDLIRVVRNVEITTWNINRLASDKAIRATTDELVVRARRSVVPTAGNSPSP